MLEVNKQDRLHYRCILGVIQHNQRQIFIPLHSLQSCTLY